MPGSYMSNNSLKIDEASNSVLVFGTQIKTEPIINFIKLVDRDNNKKPYWIEMNFIDSELFKSILLTDYSQASIINVDKDSFLILLTPSEYEEVVSLKKVIDLPPNSHKIVLKYIKTEDLLQNLPLSVDEDRIVLTSNPSIFFYYGEHEAYKAFMDDLSLIDKPVPQIKYKILVLQNTIGDNNNFSLNIGSHSPESGNIALPEGEWQAFSGALGSLLGLNFNVISALGPLFSFELNAAINNDESKILVDTTLQGLSGRKVSLRNTTTSRFYQSTTNANGDTEKTGATQEVSWGIILDIEGWTSGDGMITVKVQSTLSDETTVSGDSSGIPSTSEKIVNTEVRTPEGVPVVIGGLLSSKKEMTKEKTPLLGEIPLLGLLFTKHVERETKSEFIIYLLPYIEDDFVENLSQKLERAYKELVN
jgi:type II secretory pathway component GspD/PulD (secretin)